MASQIWPYIRAAGKHWFFVALAGVGVIGDLATLKGNFPVPRWIWYALIAVGLVVAQFRAYCDVMRELASARARLAEIDSDEAKRAFIDRAIGEARAFIDEYAAMDSAQWWTEFPRRQGDLNHWETSLRSQIREIWDLERANRIDSHPETGAIDVWRRPDPPDVLCAYIERRIVRLQELRDEI